MTTNSNRTAAAFQQRVDLLADALGAVVQGKAMEIRQTICCLLAEGHLLIEDKPGVGKTTLARAVAAASGLHTKRIQFTPDLLPSDVTGSDWFNQETNTWDFRPGPVFANIVIADEINRASPKAQSALLEVMEERTVTVDVTTRRLDPPFMVVATQNPADSEGTYPLPDAQMDRFLMRIELGYPDHAAEVMVLRTQKDRASVIDLAPVLSPGDLIAMTNHVKTLTVAPAIEHYIVDLAAYTRNLPEVERGASPRGSLGLLRAARAWAAIDGRMHVLPDDVKAVAVPVLSHRLVLETTARMRDDDVRDVIRRAVNQVPQPSVQGG